MDNQTTQPVVTQSPPQQPAPQSPTSSKRKIRPLLLSLLALLVVAAVGYGVYSWQHKKVSDANTKVSSLQSQISSLQARVNKLTKNTKSSSASNSQSSAKALTSFTSKDGKFSLKYPSNWVLTPGCADNQFDAGPTSSSASACNTNSNNTPEVSVSDTSKGCFPLSGYSNNTQQSVTISGVTGTEYTATAQDGTKNIEYCLPRTTLTYEAFYTQQPGYPEVSADFITMVTDSLKFN